MATGVSFHNIALSFCIGRTTASEIIKDVCKHIADILQPMYIPEPIAETWRQSESIFRNQLNAPNCIGIIDGKHVVIKSSSGPRKTSELLPPINNKSIVLFTIVDPFNKFTMIDIGSYGKYKEDGIFEKSELYLKFDVFDELVLPKIPLPGTDEPAPCVFLGNDGFVLRPYILRPFPKVKALQNEKRFMFNNHLKHLRFIVDNAFGMLSQKWNIIQRPIESDVDTAINIVKSVCCLHNYILEKEEISSNDLVRPINNPRAFVQIKPTSLRSTNIAMLVRDKFVSYYSENKTLE